MNKPVIAGIVVGVGVTVAAIAHWERYITDIQGRFPNLDRKVIRKAYRTFMKNATQGKYGPMENFSNEKMDQIFLDIVREQTASN